MLEAPEKWTQPVENLLCSQKLLQGLLLSSSSPVFVFFFGGSSVSGSCLVFGGCTWEIYHPEALETHAIEGHSHPVGARTMAYLSPSVAWCKCSYEKRLEGKNCVPGSFSWVIKLLPTPYIYLPLHVQDQQTLRTFAQFLRRATWSPSQSPREAHRYSPTETAPSQYGWKMEKEHGERCHDGWMWGDLVFRCVSQIFAGNVRLPSPVVKWGMESTWPCFVKHICSSLSNTCSSWYLHLLRNQNLENWATKR